MEVQYLIKNRDYLKQRNKEIRYTQSTYLHGSGYWLTCESELKNNAKRISALTRKIRKILNSA
jgi:hypothetical protein